MSGAWGDAWGDYGTDAPLVDNSPRVCGVGGWNGLKPGDPDNNSLLTATPAFGGIDVSWTYPTLNPHAVAHVVLYRGILPEFFGAIFHAIATGNQFYDKSTIDISTRYYYWIRIVSINGTVGELIGPATAISRLPIDQTIEALTGQIDAGMLAQALKADIGNIGLLGNSITQEVQDRMAANVALGETVAGMQAEVDNVITVVESEVNERITADAALITSLNVMATGFNDSIAGLAEEIQIQTGAGSALAQQITTLEASVNNNVITAQTAMQVKIDEVSGVVGGLWTAKINANGLIGGFGLSNNGALVEAGFDVDRFWVGRTGSDKRKPFIIEGGEVFINDAVIQKLTFNKLRSDDGAVVVENGKIKANFINATNLNVVNGTFSGSLQAANGTFVGALSAATGSFAGSLSAATGTFSGTLTASAINAVNTINIGVDQVTIPRSAYTAAGIGPGGISDGNSVSLQSLGFNSSGSPIFIFFSANVRHSSSGGSSNAIDIYRNGALLRTVFVGQTFQHSYVTQASPIFVVSFSDQPGAGYVTYDIRARVYAISYFGGSCVYSLRSLLALEAKR